MLLNSLSDQYTDNTACSANDGIYNPGRLKHTIEDSGKIGTDGSEKKEQVEIAIIGR